MVTCQVDRVANIEDKVVDVDVTKGVGLLKKRNFFLWKICGNDMGCF